MAYPIHTIDSRDNILLEVIRGSMRLGDQKMHQVIVDAKEELDQVLKRKRISYADLKNVLVPQEEKREILIVFDYTKCQKSHYGLEVFDYYFPRLLSATRKAKDSKHAVFFGDLIVDSIHDKHREVTTALVEEMNGSFEFPLAMDARKYCAVYINNLSNESYEKLVSSLGESEICVCYSDCTFSSKIKTIAAMVLPQAYIKLGSNIILSHGDDIDDTIDVNESLYDFDKYRCGVVSIRETLYHLFLSFKIDRPIFIGYDKDSIDLLNSISTVVKPLEECAVELSEAKFGYINDIKASNLKRKGLEQASREELQSLIKKGLMSTYLYNLRVNDQDQSALFSIIFELPYKRSKVTVGLKYLPVESKIFVTTFY